MDEVCHYFCLEAKITVSNFAHREISPPRGEQSDRDHAKLNQEAVSNLRARIAGSQAAADRGGAKRHWNGLSHVPGCAALHPGYYRPIALRFHSCQARS